MDMKALVAKVKSRVSRLHSLRERAWLERVSREDDALFVNGRNYTGCVVLLNVHRLQGNRAVYIDSDYLYYDTLDQAIEALEVEFEWNPITKRWYGNKVFNRWSFDWIIIQGDPQ